MIELVIRFQWVKCQLDALGRCLSLSSLRKELRSLPKDLDDTYARILQSIDNDEHSKLVAMIMQWLAYSRRPMYLMEISEVLTVDPDDDHPFDIERRLEDPQDLLRICSSLVTTVPVRRRRKYRYPPRSGEMLQLAHFSVREYLESSRTHDGPAKRYAIQDIRSNTFIAESCIIYLLHLEVSQTRTDTDYLKSLSEEYPLIEYANSSWADHAERAGEDGNIVALGKSFLMSKIYRLPEWLAFRHSRLGCCSDAQGKHLPLLYASTLNVPKITSALILEGADVNACNKDGWTTLMQITMNRNERIEFIQLLLKHGAEVNAQNRFGVTAVMIAARSGNLQTVRMLLDHGADPHAHDQDTGDTALTLATRGGHTRVVKHLLDRGVSISSHSAVEALQTASLYRQHETLQVILARGVDVDAELHHSGTVDGVVGTSVFTTALLQALENDDNKNNNDIADLLLEYGADVNARATVKGIRGVALDHALNYGQDFMVEFLLEHGADPSLVKPEHLNEDGMRRFEIMLRKIESQKRSLQVQEEETEEALADA